MTAPHRVVVDGPPVEADISWEQVREYLARRAEHAWLARQIFDAPSADGADDAAIMRASINLIASVEARHAADVLRDIAAVEAHAQEPATEPAVLTEEELAAIEVLAAAATDEPDEERDCRRCGQTMAAPDEGCEPSPLCHSCGHHVAAELATAVRRLIATVREYRGAGGTGGGGREAVRRAGADPVLGWHQRLRARRGTG